VLQLLRRSVDELGQSVVMVTHDPEAAAYADRLIVLRDGLVVHDAQAGTAAEVIELMKEVA
jgi:putative ABC transport system ATP-binding protein